MAVKERQATLEVVGAPEESKALMLPEGDSFVSMVERLAANPSVDVDKLRAILDLQERVIDRNAKAEFDAAYASMQGEIPTITERGEILINGQLRSKYAKLEDILDVVRPILQKHGFAIRHQNEFTGTENKLKVVGILSHRSGHSERDEFVTDADTGAGRSAIQALGSARSYGQRYTTIALLGIATRGQDDDGKGSQVRTDIKAPEGFEAWWAIFESVADSGLPALTKAWNESKPEFRNHLMKTNKHAFAQLKAKAAAVKS